MRPGGPLSRRLLLAGLSVLPFANARADDRAAWAALRSGGHVALMRHALAPGSYDPPDFRLDDCSTQRNLSAEGRAQAGRAGDLFRANGIATAKVHSSQWCRCLETSELLKLGAVKPQPLLNAYAGDSAGGRSARDPEKATALRRWIAQQDLSGPIVLVTHEVFIETLISVRTDSVEIVVVRLGGDGALTVASRLSTT